MRSGKSSSGSAPIEVELANERAKIPMFEELREPTEKRREEKHGEDRENHSQLI
jgi:hypothetical protein